MLVMVSKLLVIRVMNVDTEIFQIDVTAKETRTPAKGLFHDDLQEKRRDRSFLPFNLALDQQTKREWVVLTQVLFI